MDVLRWQTRPTLRRPVLVVAFEGWTDAGDAASMAGRWLTTAWRTRPFADIDPEEFYDFTTVRPHVSLPDGITRRIDWPSLEFSATSVPGGDHDVVFLRGHEPALRWRGFAGAVAELATALDVELCVTLGALLARVSHSWPIAVSGTSSDDALVERFGLSRSRYEGPTSMLTVLADTLSRAGVPTAGLWAAVPLYHPEVPSAKAALALVDAIVSMVGGQVDTTELADAAEAYERRMTDVVAENEDWAAYVASLEAEGPDDDEQLPSADALAAEAERFLRDQNGDDPPAT